MLLQELPTYYRHRVCRYSCLHITDVGEITSLAIWRNKEYAVATHVSAGRRSSHFFNEIDRSRYQAS